MNRPSRIAKTAVLVACCTCCAAQPAERASDRTSPMDAGSTVVPAGNAFGLDLYARLRHREGNLALSPLSISLALGMTYAGARGETAAQMARVLHLERIDPGTVHRELSHLLAGWNDPDRTAYDLRVANRLFCERSMVFREAFTDLTREIYGAPLEPLDFRGAAEPSRLRINAWIEEKTNQRIRDLLPAGSIKAHTRLVLANAIYFKGRWRSRFDEQHTRPLPFRLRNGTTVDVPTMHQEEEYGYASLDGLQVLRMPYVGDELAMYLLLPVEEGGIGDLEERLTHENLERWILAAREREVLVWLPRFTIDPPAPIALEEVLSAMGMPLPFGETADFTGMSDVRPPLFIDDVYHKAFVEVNEEGTEAAAATGVTVGITSVPLRPPEFRADHPFLFLIRDLRSGSILFMGRVTDPSG